MLLPTFLKGDAREPIGEGNKLIVHICNDIGKWGKGFVLALSEKWKEPETQYRDWHSHANHFSLGHIGIVQVEDDIWVINMIAQKNIRVWRGEPPIRYDAVRECLCKVAKIAIENNASVHMPRIGTGLAGGKWGIIEDIIMEQLCQRDIPVYVYDYKGN